MSITCNIYYNKSHVCLYKSTGLHLKKDYITQDMNSQRSASLPCVPLVHLPVV